MLKTLGVIVGGIFVGAVVMEVLRTKCPDKLDKFFAKVSDLSSGIREGFCEGYSRVAEPSASAQK